MPRYDVLTPLRRDGKITRPGRTVEMTEAEARPLLACGALAPAKEAAPATPGTPKPPEKPSGGQKGGGAR